MPIVSFFIVAGEASGDYLGAEIVRALMQYFACHYPHIRLNFVGIAGEKMQQEGVVSLFPMEKLSVMGFSEVLCRARELLSLQRHVKQYCLAHQPVIYIGIDAPDFNLPIERTVRKNGICTVHVNSPTIWAWRESRLKKIKQAVNLMLVLFPFESIYYTRAYIPVEYIGHPLADAIPCDLPADGLSKSENNAEKKIIALLPGSRMGEIKHIGPLLLRSAVLFHQKYPESSFLSPLVNTAQAALFQTQASQLAPSLPLKLSLRNARDVIQQSNAVVLASGTATLETLLLKKPMVVVYKTSFFSYWIARWLIHTPFIALPNILSGRCLVPEWIQKEATPERVMQSLEHYFTHPLGIKNLEQDYQLIHSSLRKNAAQKAAEAITKQWMSLSGFKKN